MTTWLKDVWEGFYTVLVGMKITWRHLFVDNLPKPESHPRWLAARSRSRAPTRPSAVLSAATVFAASSRACSASTR